MNCGTEYERRPKCSGRHGCVLLKPINLDYSSAIVFALHHVLAHITIFIDMHSVTLPCSITLLNCSRPVGERLFIFSLALGRFSSICFRDH